MSTSRTGHISLTFKPAVDGSSCFNGKLMSPTTKSSKEKWSTEQDCEPELLTGLSFYPVKRVMTLPFGGMEKEQRRELRKKLKEDLITVQSLSLKLEARELQLRQSQSVQMHPNLSDAQFSGNDVRTSGGKEVTSQTDFTSPRLGQHRVELLKQLSFRASDSSPTGAELLSNKRTPKANQLYSKSEFVVGKDKMPLPMKSRTKHGNGKRRTSNANGGNGKKKSAGIPTDIRLQCKSVLNKIMSHRDGWIFNHPVDAVKLGLSDYHLVINKPMDLGTIRAKLDRKQYGAALEFADDVRLTFSNAMTYNPPANDVHQLAVELSDMFEKGWEIINEKLERLDAQGELEVPLSQVLDAYHASSGTEGLPDHSRSSKKSSNAARLKTPKIQAEPKLRAKPKAAPKPRVKGQKRAMTLQDKAELQRILEQLPEQMLEGIIGLMKERNINMCQKGDEIEVDLGSFDNDTLWELDRCAKDCLRSVDKSKKAVAQKTQPAENITAQNTSKMEKDKDTASGSRSSSSGSSSSDSGSSSDSDTGSSSTSESDADDILKKQ